LIWGWLRFPLTSGRWSTGRSITSVPEQDWKIYWQKVRAALSEGMCLRCQGSLEPAPYHPLSEKRMIGWCSTCEFYWTASPEGGASFETGYYLEGRRHAYQKVMGYPIS
jgi:hypothetical protein